MKAPSSSVPEREEKSTCGINVSHACGNTFTIRLRITSYVIIAGDDMVRKPLGSGLLTLKSSVKRTVRRTPPNSAVSFRYDKTSERLQAVKYEEYDDTIFFEPTYGSTHTIGYVRLNFRGEKDLNIDFLEVYEPFRKRGYGKEIYKWTESYAREKGMEKITVISLEDAVGFWKKMKLKRGLWSKPGYLSMEKALSDS